MTEQVMITIKTGNAAFMDDSYGPELARILHTMADQFARGDMPSWPRDVNGNSVGKIQGAFGKGGRTR